jgi:hypothetical protein
MFINTDGKIVFEKSVNLVNGDNLIDLSVDELDTNSSIIFYSLLLDGKVVDTKKMFLHK